MHVQIEKAKTDAIKLKSICNDRLILDSLNVIELVNLNNDLTQNLIKSFVLLENDKRSKKKTEIINLTTQIEAIENQICIVVRRYNKNCNILRKSYLLFESNCEMSPPKVVF